ncbi:hypothetical protein ZWY2020_048992 [Hordeum vulgare]|nr:hypothetical protein ZWY2020_048992 [Hordeum vulgare]
MASRRGSHPVPPTRSVHLSEPSSPGGGETMGEGMEGLAQRAALLRESLGRSQAATDAVVSILSFFDILLSALDAAMRPIQLLTHAVRSNPLPPCPTPCALCGCCSDLRCVALLAGTMAGR